MVAPFQPDPAKLAAIREALPATGAGIYLDTGTCGPLPAETVRAMRELEDWELRVDRADPAAGEMFQERMAECRGVLAALLSSDPRSIALTHSATEGLNIACGALDWHAGDRALTTNAEHAGLLGPLAALRDRAGVAIDVVDIAAGHDPALVLERVTKALRPRTRLVALSHVLWTTGAILPVAEIGLIARASGAWYVVDAAQSVGAIPVDAAGIGADFIAFSGQKWLLGPEGSGGLWASDRATAGAVPLTAGGLSFAALDPRARGKRWPDARRFETAGYNRPATVGLARSVGWLEMYVGLTWAYRRATRLARVVADRLGTIPGLTLLTPRERMATLVAFRVRGWSPHQLSEELSRRAFAITRPVDDINALRISIGFHNSEDELERFAVAVEEIARHTPATLPRRPELVVVGTDGTPGA